MYNPNDVLDPSQGSRIQYDLDQGLLKKYSEISVNGNDWIKSIEHNNVGNLTAIQMFENPNSGHLYRLEFTEWDDKENTNIFASNLQTYPSMDIIPGIKLSNNNMINRRSLYLGQENSGPNGHNFEYNDFDQITRIYTISGDQTNEEGDIVVMGGKEVTVVIFEYVVLDK